MLLKKLLSILGVLLLFYAVPNTGLTHDFGSTISKTEIKKTCNSNSPTKGCSKQCLQFPANTNNSNKSDFPTECPSPSFFLGEIWKFNYFKSLALESQIPRSLSNLHNSLYQETDPKPPRFLMI